MAIASGSNPMEGVSQDATSEIYCPADAAEWTTTMAAAGLASGNPSNLWLMQEAAFPFVDTIGGVSLSGASATAQNPVSGWTRLAAGTADGTSNGWSTVSIVNNAAASYALLAYVALTDTPGSARTVFGFGAAGDHRYVGVTTTPRYRAGIFLGGTTDGTGTPGAAVHPVMLLVDRTNSRLRVYTDQEIISLAWAAPVAGGALLNFGDQIGIGSAPAHFLYSAGFASAAAELSDANVRTLLETLGWTVDW
jgi:hypothetical protein